MASLSHRQGWSLAVILTIFPCFLFSGSGSGGNNPQITYHTGTSEVRVAFFATDQNGRLLYASGRSAVSLPGPVMSA